MKTLLRLLRRRHPFSINLDGLNVEEDGRPLFGEEDQPQF